LVLLEFKRKWIVLDANHKIIIITRDKRIAISFAKQRGLKNDQ
tara:strand:- start:932 stop:1060 length:129 start_codon:yes stop_codon:yes gene_type:complete